MHSLNSSGDFFYSASPPFFLDSNEGEWMHGDQPAEPVSERMEEQPDHFAPRESAYSPKFLDERYHHPRPYPSQEIREVSVLRKTREEGEKAKFFLKRLEVKENVEKNFALVGMTFSFFERRGNPCELQKLSFDSLCFLREKKISFLCIEHPQEHLRNRLQLQIFNQSKSYVLEGKNLVNLDSIACFGFKLNKIARNGKDKVKDNFSVLEVLFDHQVIYTQKIFLRNPTFCLTKKLINPQESPSHHIFKPLYSGSSPIHSLTEECEAESLIFLFKKKNIPLKTVEEMEKEMGFCFSKKERLFYEESDRSVCASETTTESSSS